MKILGLFIVVFVIVFIDIKIFEFSEMGTMIGTIIGAGTYIMLVNK